MQNHPIPIAVAILLLLTAATAHAQDDDRVSTRLEVSEPDPVEDWDGATITRTVEARLCYDEGAVNTNQQSFRINVTVNDIPEWVNVSHAGSITLTPPIGPTTEEGCTDPETIEIELRGDNATGTTGTDRMDGANDTADGMGNDTSQDPAPGVREGESFSVQVVLTPATEPDPITGDDQVGNYETPAEESVTFQVRTQGDPERVPAIGAVAVVLAVLAGLVAARRRR